MTGKFKIFRNGKVESYTNYNEIPETFEHVIQCEFDVPEPPHTEEEHELMHSFQHLLKDLVKREQHGD